MDIHALATDVYGRQPITLYSGAVYVHVYPMQRCLASLQILAQIAESQKTYRCQVLSPGKKHDHAENTQALQTTREAAAAWV